MKTLLMLALVLVFLTACEQPTGIDLTPGNNGQTLDITQNQVLNIKLDSNVTTGYKWNLVTAPNDKILKLVSSDYVGPTPGSQPIAGAGGYELWKFQAVGTGTTTLKLGYARPWETNTPPIKDFTFTVNVR